VIGRGGVDQGDVVDKPGRFDRRDLLVLLGLLVLAALLRVPELAARGTWESDQGHDMLVLRSLVRDGVVPLLGPPTSIGDVHHGAWYYYLLSPAAFLTGGDSPLAVVSLIAAAGIAAVGVVWWLARSIGGPVAGLVAGLVMAISIAAVDESTFIWNPNLIALSSATALAGAWRAWSRGDRRWWIVAAIGTAVTMQCHVLGIAMLPVIGAVFLLDARRRDLGREAVAWVVVFVIAYAPLLVNELTTDFSETRAAIDYVSGGRESSPTALPVRFGIVGLRVVSWPLVGLITDGFVPGVIATAAVVGIVAWRWRRVSEAPVVRWLGLGLLWSSVALTIAAPSLAVVVPGLPNDHYHAFADPMVFVLVGLGSAALLGARGAARAAASSTAAPAAPAAAVARPVSVAPVLAVVGLVALAVWNLTHQPPSPHPDGGFPAGEAAGDRVDAALSSAGVERDDVVLLRSLPDFKSTEAVAYPLSRLERAFVAETPKGVAPGSVDVVAITSPGGFAGLVLLCDDRFAEAIGAPCGGAAEAAVTPDEGGADSEWGPLVDRFLTAPDRWVSVYGPTP
jgi:4-amino-4-deoxy-L-arabinose transferase-like glycosyltransferase